MRTKAVLTLLLTAIFLAGSAGYASAIGCSLSSSSDNRYVTFNISLTDIDPSQAQLSVKNASGDTVLTSNLRTHCDVSGQVATCDPRFDFDRISANQDTIQNYTVDVKYQPAGQPSFVAPNSACSSQPLNVTITPDAPAQNTTTGNEPESAGTITPMGHDDRTSSSSLSDFKTLDQQILNDVNPLQQFGDATLTTPGAVISKFMTMFAFPIAGFILFVMIVVGGFEILAGSATKKSIDSGKQRITNALIGFMLLFTSYWIIQVIQTVFGIKVL